MASIRVKRERKANFTDLENKVLLSNIQKYSKVLFGKLPYGSTGQQKHLAWVKVAKAVNAVSTESRTLEEVKNRWKKHKQTFKKHNLFPAIDKVFKEEPYRDDFDSDNQNASDSTVENPLHVLNTELNTSDNVDSEPTQPTTGNKERAKSQGIDDGTEEVCLRWNSHHSNMQTTFPSLLDKHQYVDCSLAVEGKRIKCHRLILGSCSSYFDEILSTFSPYEHPIIFLKDIQYWVLKALIDFMYVGEVHIDQTKLRDLLSAAEVLKIKGLAGSKHEDGSDGSPTEKPESVNETLHEPSTNAQKSKEEPVSPPAQSSSDPLALLQPIYFEEHTPEPSFSKSSGNTKKTTAKKIKKRKLSEHELSPPPVLFRKGTRTRPNVKIPRQYQDEFETVGRKSYSEHSQQNENSSDSIKIKDEPFDVEDNVFGLEDLDNSTKEENENLNILDSIRLKSVVNEEPNELKRESIESENQNENSFTKMELVELEDGPQAMECQESTSGLNFNTISILKPEEIISKIEMTGAMEITPLNNVKK